MEVERNSVTPASRTTQMTYEILPDRMPPIAEGEMTEAQRQAADLVRTGPRGEVRGPYWPILRSPGFMKSVQSVGVYTRYECPLDHRINELATMMGVRQWSQQYVWNAHYGKAIRSGIKPSTLDAVAEGRRPPEMPKDEETLYEFLMELFANKSVSDPTYDRTVKEFGEAGVIDILGIVGYYTMASMIMNVARTALTDGRPLPLQPVPAQLRSLTPGAVSPADYSLIPSQEKEFERP